MRLTGFRSTNTSARTAQELAAPCHNSERGKKRKRTSHSSSSIKVKVDEALYSCTSDLSRAIAEDIKRCVHGKRRQKNSALRNLTSTVFWKHRIGTVLARRRKPAASGAITNYHFIRRLVYTLRVFLVEVSFRTRIPLGRMLPSHKRRATHSNETFTC